MKRESRAQHNSLLLSGLFNDVYSTKKQTNEEKVVQLHKKAKGGVQQNIMLNNDWNNED